MRKKSFELVVPAYNEAKNLHSVIERAVKSAQDSGFSSDEFKLLVVNNGSQDDSAKVLTELKATSLGPWFRVVHVTVNQGYGFGVYSGLRETQADVVGWSHADMQCDPLNAFKAYEVFHAQEGSSPWLVKGTRSGRNWKDILVSRVFEFIARVVLGLKAREVNAQPKVFNKELLSHIKNPPNTFAFDLYVLYCAEKAGYKTKEINVLFPPRIHGVSNWASTFLGRYKTILGMIKYIVQLTRTEGRL